MIFLEQIFKKKNRTSFLEENLKKRDVATMEAKTHVILDFHVIVQVSS